MEYPTFFTAGGSWFDPEASLGEPEGVIEHEYGHQYWYGMVATNEFEDAWMDEGINQYTEVKVMDSLFGPSTSIFNHLWGITAGEREADRIFMLPSADFDPMTRKGWQFADSGSYGGITYGKTAVVLLTLEGIIGEDTMRQAMHTYFMRYRFTHPSREDFLKTIEEVSGKDLRWYFNQAVYGTQVMDFQVHKVSSVPVEWYKEDLKEKKGETQYIDNVWIQRKGEFVIPIDVEIRFDNGELAREHWDAQDRWVRYEYQKKAKVAAVEIDPDHKLQFNRDNFKGDYIAKANMAPARKLVHYWEFISQFVAQVLAWFLV
jgi:aminopeptidase N